MLSAWQALQIQYGCYDFDLVHYSVVPENDTLVIVDLLYRVRAGFFSRMSQLAESRLLGFLTFHSVTVAGSLLGVAIILSMLQ